MNKIITILLAVGMAFSLRAQNQKIQLEEIWSGAFRTQGMEVLRSMNSGIEYTILNYENGERTIDQYAYKTLEKIKTIVKSGGQIPKFSNYDFSDDESKVLLATEVEPIFRRSSVGLYYVYDLNTKQLKKVREEKIQEPVLSPDGSKVAYAYQNNLYLLDLGTSTTTQLTTDGIVGSIINGTTDWVYEEEFGFVQAYEWNKSGTKIAFLRFDESRVPNFSMDVYGTQLYPWQYEFKYPKAGEDNAEVSLHLYDLKTKTITNVDLNQAYYIPRIAWSNLDNLLMVQTLNRHQNSLKLYGVDARTNKVELVLEETDDAYVDVHDNLTFVGDENFIWTSEKDGWNHLYLYDITGNQLAQITKGNWEVTEYYGYDQANDKIYYQSSEEGSINRTVYSISSTGEEKKKLTQKTGTNNASFSSDYTYFINTYSDAQTPYQFTLHRASDGKELKRIKDNKALLDKLANYDISPKEFSTLNINGNDLNMWMVKPKDFDPSKKYPLLMFQYSGPGSQQVANSWMGANDYWHQMLAQQGYIIACVDGRGTGFKGRDFKKVTYLNLVKYETEDQIAAAKELSTLPYIDENRTGIWGWSFGGHMSTNCILKGNDTFETAIAVAPVTSWRFYDTIYTERFLRTPQENPEGYDNESPFNYPELLEGKYLLVHGSGDDNVHVQNSMRMIEALIQANKPFDWAIYPDKNHGIYGGNTRLHLYSKMTNFILEHL